MARLTKIGAAVKRWFYPAPPVYRFAVTVNSVMRQQTKDLYTPVPPSEPGNWELVAVVSRGIEIVFWWKTLDEGQPQGEK